MIWQNRYTVREFDWDTIPERSTIDKIGSIVKHIPIVEGKIDHLWFELGPDDHDIKEWLITNIFIRFSNELGIKEHMLPIVNAPYVFLAYSYDTGEPENIKRQSQAIGFHAGCILTESLHAGLDVSQIGCTQGISKKFNENYKNAREDCKTLFKERFKTSEFDLSKLLIPVLAICVGKGLPISEGYMEYKGMQWNKGKKVGKTQDNLLK